MADTCNCRFKHCLHKGEPVLKSEAVRVGSSTYYHPDCYETKNKIAELIDYFSKNINPNVVFAELNRQIYDILFPKDRPGVPIDQLLFQVKYYVGHGGGIRYPGGMRYALQDRDAYAAYQKYRARKTLEGTSFDIDDNQNQSAEGSYRIRKQKSFEDILGPAC